MSRRVVCAEHEYNFMNQGEGNLLIGAFNVDIAKCNEDALEKGYKDVHVHFRTDEDRLYIKLTGEIPTSEDMSTFIQTVMFSDAASKEDKAFAKEYFSILMQKAAGYNQGAAFIK